MNTRLIAQGGENTLTSRKLEEFRNMNSRHHLCWFLTKSRVHGKTDFEKEHLGQLLQRKLQVDHAGRHHAFEEIKELKLSVVRRLLQGAS